MVDELILSQKLFSESDIVSLSDDFIVSSDVLYDKATMARHKIHPLMAKALNFLRQPAAFRRWVLQMSQLGLSLENAREITLFINGIGGFRVKKSFRSFIKQYTGLQRLAIRHRANFVGVAVASTKICLPLIAAVLATAALAYDAGLDLKEAICYPGLFLVSLALSLWLHELTHISFIKSAGAPSAVVRRGLRIGIIHGQVTAKYNLFSSVGGPLVGAISAVLIADAGSQIINLPLGSAVGYLVAIFHLISLLPMFGDGQTIVRLIRPESYESASLKSSS